ncbi:acetyltransferase [Desulfitobacterium metallireducens DSM 15288]|uniref:Acetyltransferase n=2 Tax=Desulfitobacterium TaxID=36853 RepID=W0EAD8_9FIRM|nr:GNAT family N-acetyltransferase [Desulfitobacterium metallireducens]AHF06503.1 acetyltransferase [Desulfitobacterium metallireducens DSM 15288]
MINVRLAQSGEIVRQKEIWKRCFGDADSFIDFYYDNRYKAEDTVVLLDKGQIAAMLTQIPIRVVTQDQRSLNSAMFYAIATHPDDQHRGLATQIIDFSNQFLGQTQKELSVLVPAGKPLFDFYRKLGYQEGFYIRESVLQGNELDPFALHKISPCRISAITPEKYNQRRDQQLKGKLYVAYNDEEIAYQKKLSQMSGAEIYALDCGEGQGCVAIERVTYDKVLIKEILISGELIPNALKEIALHISAKEYVVRTPTYLGENLGGSIHPFGMFKMQRKSDVEITPEASGYLGLAFD